MLKKILGTILIASCCLTISVAAAASGAKNKIVLQLTDSSPEKQVLVLNVAQNLLKTYGDDVEIEVVAFGPGLPILLTDNPNNKRIQNLASKGIRFSACRNTVKKVSRLAGEAPTLNPDAKQVSGGAERIIELVSQGYILIRP
jgi:intracellular sulfur oxidation DsrE/DsrF family protein